MSRSTYIALLRGINVGGNRRLKMTDLQYALRELGLEDIHTYIQSGNVIFQTHQQNPQSLAKKIEAKLLNSFSLSVSVIVITPAEIERIIRSNPFLTESGIDDTHLHVTFLSDVLPSSARITLASIQAGKDRFTCGLKEIYLHCPDGYGETRLSNMAVEKLLSLRATTRNWKTINKLHELSQR